MSFVEWRRPERRRRAILGVHEFSFTVRHPACPAGNTVNADLRNTAIMTARR
jgi:hypothetical protein